jgi:DNA-binding response OmpR family regulator
LARTHHRDWRRGPGERAPQSGRPRHPRRHAARFERLEVCRALRADKTTAAIPIIMLTARAEESDRIIGLEIGADDYISKPFSPNELVARVRALMRRSKRTEPEGSTLAFGPLVMDLGGTRSSTRGAR